MSLIVKIFTDGACSGNPGPGGWGAFIQYGAMDKSIWGYDLATTNNKMELQAPLEAIRTLEEMHIKERQIYIYTDSKYLIQGVTDWVYKWKKNNWLKSDKKPVLNQELWEKLLFFTEKLKIHWFWVKGHSGVVENDTADALARKGRDYALHEIHKKSFI